MCYLSGAKALPLAVERISRACLGPWLARGCSGRVSGARGLARGGLYAAWGVASGRMAPGWVAAWTKAVQVRMSFARAIGLVR